MAAANNYWKNIGTAVTTLWHGLRLTGRHMIAARKSKTSTDITATDYFQKQVGIQTIQFPHESIPVPDVGRYKLHNEIDDCIVCDMCAKICPVNCITIEAIRSPEEFGKTSDGTSKRIYAAKFDIDMGKCCFCGLCTTVCPTECLTMTKDYDFSVFDIREHNFPFGTMGEGEIETRKKEWALHQQAKVAQKTEGTTPTPSPNPPTAGAKPVFRPKVKPSTPPPPPEA